MNFADAETCRRCRSDLFGVPAAAGDVAKAAAPSRGVGRRIAFILGAIFLSIFAWSRSLLLTSTPIDDDQLAVVMRAVGVLEHAGFSKEVFVLRHFANYRATDNWWNIHVGHSQAYAATNFPLGVVTLYEPFFRVSADDTERAAILLHEAQHLLGAGESAALETTWRQKSRLGWTEEQYGGTKVWRNTREWTIAEISSLFRCGPDGASDCAP